MQRKILPPGGAGLVSQNLGAQPKERGYINLVILDKHRLNLDILHRLRPELTIEYADLAKSGAWERHFEDANTVVMMQAQIGCLYPSPSYATTSLPPGVSSR